jgi:tetratricopeptide (TPR) repeat protein
MRSWLFVLWLMGSVGVWAQSSAPSGSTPAGSTPASSSPSSSGASQAAAPAPNLGPPSSDRVQSNDGSFEAGESSSKDEPVDLSPPPNDDKAHPQSSDVLMDAETAHGGSDVGEFHPWNPHKAAKDIEVGDFYFKRKNYRAAEDRYREALLYKENDAVATIRIATCLEKLNQPDEALKEYGSYLKILPHGPQAEEARKAMQRLQGAAASAKPAR